MSTNQKQSIRVTCVLGKEGWCAVKGNPKLSEVKDWKEVPTLCDSLLTFAKSFKKGEPTCDGCLDILEK